MNPRTYPPCSLNSPLGTQRPGHSTRYVRTGLLTRDYDPRPRQRGGSNIGSAMRRPTLLQARYGILADLRSLKCSCSLAQWTRLAHYPLEDILFTNAPGYMGRSCRCDNKSIRSCGGIARGAGTTTIWCDRTIEKDKNLSKGGWLGWVTIPR